MKKIGTFIQIMGCLLIIVGFSTFLLTQMNSNRAQKKKEVIVNQIESLLPDRTSGTIEDYTSMTMPVLQIEGKDFAGLVEIPAVGIKLPIYNTWDTSIINVYACRFYGTVYDGSLVIGGADQEGQFDCFDQLREETEIQVTDMAGTEFIYHIKRIDRAESADQDRLLNEEFDLTLFVRDRFSLDYLIVRCMKGDFR